MFAVHLKTERGDTMLPNTFKREETALRYAKIKAGEYGHVRQDGFVFVATCADVTVATVSVCTLVVGFPLGA